MSRAEKPRRVEVPAVRLNFSRDLRTHQRDVPSMSMLPPSRSLAAAQRLDVWMASRGVHRTPVIGFGPAGVSRELKCRLRRTRPGQSARS